jgi:hypothetical protein
MNEKRAMKYLLIFENVAGTMHPSNKTSLKIAWPETPNAA